MGSVGILQIIRCGAHTLQLVVFDSLKKDKTIEKTLSKARLKATHFRCCYKVEQGDKELIAKMSHLLLN